MEEKKPSEQCRLVGSVMSSRRVAGKIYWCFSEVLRRDTTIRNLLEVLHVEQVKKQRLDGPRRMRIPSGSGDGSNLTGH